MFKVDSYKTGSQMVWKYYSQKNEPIAKIRSVSDGYLLFIAGKGFTGKYESHRQAYIEMIKYVGFEFEGVFITNPYMDETGRIEVDPFTYYGLKLD